MFFSFFCFILQIAFPITNASFVVPAVVKCKPSDLPSFLYNYTLWCNLKVDKHLFVECFPVAEACQEEICHHLVFAAIPTVPKFAASCFDVNDPDAAPCLQQAVFCWFTDRIIPDSEYDVPFYIVTGIAIVMFASMVVCLTLLVLTKNRCFNRPSYETVEDNNNSEEDDVGQQNEDLRTSVQTQQQIGMNETDQQLEAAEASAALQEITDTLAAVAAAIVGRSTPSAVSSSAPPSTSAYNLCSSTARRLSTLKKREYLCDEDCVESSDGFCNSNTNPFGPDDPRFTVGGLSSSSSSDVHPH